jgi:hypothetical protein
LLLSGSGYFFFFGAAFFFAAFLVAFFIDRFSLDIRFAISKRSQRDSYIRLVAPKVKRKMHPGRSDPRAPPRTATKKRWLREMFQRWLASKRPQGYDLEK